MPISLRGHARRRLLVATLVGAFASGCAAPPGPTPELNRPRPKPPRVDFADLTARTSSVDMAASVTVDELIARVMALEKDVNASARIYRLVGRYPDVALELLRGTSAAQASDPARTALAAAYDRAFTSEQATGWTKSLADAAANPEAFDSIHNARLLTLQMIERGRPEQAVAQPQVQGLSFPPARAELHRLRGIAALLCDRPPEAMREWRAAETLAKFDRSVLAELRLLEAEAYRGGGNQAESNACWAAAADTAVGIHDPALWERLIAARDGTATWPSNVATRFARSRLLPPREGIGLAETAEANIWNRIGEWRLARAEAAAALLAFKQSESLSTSTQGRAEARISEARVLLTLNQTGAASSILASLTHDPDPLVSHHALAVLGNVRVTQDDVHGALTLLQAAVANDGNLPAALRAPTRADLGLVLLISRREQEGLDWLHKAQADFEFAHDAAGLVQSLSNEAAYLDEVGRDSQAHGLRTRASQLSSTFEKSE